MFGSVRRSAQPDADSIMAIYEELSRRIDVIECTSLPQMQKDIVTKTLDVPILANNISVLQAKTQGLVERCNKHLPVSGVPSEPEAKPPNSSQGSAAEATAQTPKALTEQEQAIAQYTALPVPSAPPSVLAVASSTLSLPQQATSQQFCPRPS